MRRIAVAFALAVAACGPSGSVDPGDAGGDETDAGVADVSLPSCAATDPRSAPVELSVLPDQGEAPYVDVLSKAQTSIRMMIYEMGTGGVLDTLLSKAKAGVKVQVIFDASEQSVNQKYFDQIVAAGGAGLWSDPQFTYMHAKTFVVDGTEAVVSTGNFSKAYSVDVERNYVAHIVDPNDVAVLTSLFDADWNRTSPDLSCTRLLVSPVNSRERILALIHAAQTSIDIESMEYADTDVRAAVNERKQAGVAVRALLAAPSWISSNTDAAALLASEQIPARYMTTPNVHVKSMVVDGAWVYVGSENLSWTSLDKNREVGLVTGDADAVKVVAGTFEKDWAGATPF